MKEKEAQQPVVVSDRMIARGDPRVQDRRCWFVHQCRLDGPRQLLIIKVGSHLMHTGGECNRLHSGN